MPRTPHLCPRCPLLRMDSQRWKEGELSAARLGLRGSRLHRGMWTLISVPPRPSPLPHPLRSTDLVHRPQIRGCYRHIPLPALQEPIPGLPGALPVPAYPLLLLLAPPSHHCPPSPGSNCPVLVWPLPRCACRSEAQERLQGGGQAWKGCGDPPCPGGRGRGEGRAQSRRICSGAQAPGTHRCGRSRRRPAAPAAPRRSVASHRRRPAAAPRSPSPGRRAWRMGHPRPRIPPPPLPGGAAGPGSARPCGPGLPRTGHCHGAGPEGGRTESGVGGAPKRGGCQLHGGWAPGHSTSTWSRPRTA